MPDDTTQLRPLLIRAYEALPPLEQAVLQLLSIVYEPIVKTSLMEAIRRCTAPVFKVKGFPQPGLTPVIVKLVDGGLVTTPQNQLQCHPLIVEEATRRAIQDGRFEDLAKGVQQLVKLQGWGDYFYFYSYDQALRELRLAVYRRDAPKLQRLLNNVSARFPGEFCRQSPWLLIFNNPFAEEWLRTLPDNLMAEALTTILTDSVRHFEPAPEAVALAETLVSEHRGGEALRYGLIEQQLLRGDIAPARQRLGADDSEHGRLLQGWLAFLSGADEEALQHYEAALKLLRQRTHKRKIFFDNLAGVTFILTLLASNSTARLRQAAELTAMFDGAALYRYTHIYQILRHVVLSQEGQRQSSLPVIPAAHLTVIDSFFQLLALVWLNTTAPEALRGPTETLLNAARQAGYRWFETTLAELSARLGGLPAPAGTGERRLLSLFKRQEPWEHALNRLLEVGRGSREQVETGAPIRLAWWLKWHKGGSCTISPREQKRDARGLWTRGRPVALKRLHQQGNRPAYLTPQDLRICASIHSEYGGYYGGTSYEIDDRQALAAMVGHPLVFWEDAPEARVEVVRGEPELLITPHRGQWRIVLSPQAEPGQTVGVIKETPTRLKVIEFSKAHQQVLAILGDGLLVPEVAKERVLQTVAALSSLVTVQSSLGGGLENLEEVTADPQPHVHLLPFGAGLKIELLVRPFATGGPYYRPGRGGEQLIAELDGKRRQTRRDLKQERQRAAQVIKAAPTLSRLAAVDGEWVLTEPEECLEALLELQTMGDLAALEWPEGEKFKVSRPVSAQQLRVTIKRQQDWFSLTGEVRVADDLVLDMRRLLELIGQTPSRFVPLGEGQFLALTQEFRRRLEDLRGLTETTAKGLRFHPLAALALEEFTAEAGGVRSDADWKACLQRLREAEALQPVVPSTLQGELRDYQTEGFCWLARLAHWGVGACLADDMGLGKTVQALAVLLSRAQDGPALVVAPTSVCLNWLDETRRFAPTLNAMIFGGGDRDQQLQRLGPFDLLICSYGLLQQEAERLAARPWRTIVLDEAQAIKNLATKRSQAAMTLQGDFKMITTGTPIENHLGELWNLFRFINPGLLGSLERFNQRFATPIERDQDAQARHRLKKLIQPFILRRLKSEVLEALPSRTEILRRVELGPEERALYEALRQQALARLARLDDTEGQKPLQILAEIMKLRRACCHPRLVLPESSLSGAKLAVFEEMLDDLLESRHKALVFSQFVDHLTILREVLDRKGVVYQYLDGSTPAVERKKRVDAFQSGQGDVFLISLKAGGLGLNLTAADYVIHMDPWWNPAVEDQAADRAHRIGQQRPVTIYRLVTQDTIEEKIVALHHHKRDLAESLLEGTGAGGRISAEELLRLLQEG